MPDNVWTSKIPAPRRLVLQTVAAGLEVDEKNCNPFPSLRLVNVTAECHVLTRIARRLLRDNRMVPSLSGRWDCRGPAGASRSSIVAITGQVMNDIRTAESLAGRNLLSNLNCWEADWYVTQSSTNEILCWRVCWRWQGNELLNWFPS